MEIDMHTFKRNDTVTVFHMDWDGRLKIEGRATILRPIKDVDEQYRVRFHDRDGKPALGEDYERFVDPYGQSDPDLYVIDTNNAIAAAARAA